MSLLKCVTGLGIAAFVGFGAFAQEMDHNAHQAISSEPFAALNEPGQGAFAALSEVVRVLEADPDTNWAKVNITALRDHLIDMDILVRDVRVTQDILVNGIKSTVSGDPIPLQAAKRMVPAHANELAKDKRWNVEALVSDDTVVLIVASDDAVTIARIQALGFYGLMASQDHHREHHYIIAIGGEAHSGH